MDDALGVCACDAVRLLELLPDMICESVTLAVSEAEVDNVTVWLDEMLRAHEVLSANAIRPR